MESICDYKLSPRTALFRAITQREVVIPHHRFGTTFGPILSVKNVILHS